MYRRSKREPKPTSCDRCGHLGLLPRGEFWGCLSCGLWWPYIAQDTFGWVYLWRKK